MQQSSPDTVRQMDNTDRNVLRRLAGRAAEIAALPEQDELRQRWYRHNALEPGRPMLLCFPEGSWVELLPEDALQCTAPTARAWETSLRARIHTYEHFRDDQVVEPVFDIPCERTVGDWGVHEQKVGGEDRGSFNWIAPLRSDQDLQKLRFKEDTLDHEATLRNVELANEVFGDLLTVRQRGAFWWSLGMTTDLIYLRGAQQILIDMYDAPEMLHTIMALLRDGTIRQLEYLEKEGALSLNNEGDYVGSGGFGYTHELPAEGFDGKVGPADMWGFGESQELAAVSPAMFEEFALQYQLPILSRFGLNCYGCCEPLDHKYDAIKKVPNLRRVSVSPWADLQVAAEALADDYVFSWKPNPADLAARSFDPEQVRARIAEALELTTGCVLEIILKDTHTCNNEPERFDRWCGTARELIAQS